MNDSQQASHARLVLYVTSIVSSLVMLDSNVVAVALPTIARSFNADFSALQWVITAYVLPFSALLLAAGAWADIYGRKRALLIGQAIFALASLACGFATSAFMLNIARACQGVGAAMLLTATLAVLNHQFHGKERAKAYAFWGSCLGIAITCGPVIGGLISSYWGWNWVFLINIPICAVLMTASQKFIPESRSPVAKRLDYPGIVTFSVGLFLVTWALIDGNALGWTSDTILMRLVGGLGLLIAFYIAERMQADPMVDFKILATRKFIGSAFAMLGYSGAAQVMIFYLPLYLQNTFGFAPAKAGLAMLPFALPMFLVPKLVVRLSHKYSPKTMLIAGLLIASTANVFMTFCSSTDASYGLFAFAMIWAGVGAGFLNGETAKVLQSAIPPERAGMGSGISATVRFMGLLFSVAGLGALLGKVTEGRFSELATANGLSTDSAHGLVKAFLAGDSGAASGASLQQYHETLHHAFDLGFGSMAGAAGAIGLVALLLVLFIYPSEKFDPQHMSKEPNNVVVPGE
jgi:EmrB/QacA subfamily drug resistance transporter